MKKGKRYQEAVKLVEKTKLYDLEEAVSILKKSANAKFDETIEAHIRLGVDGRQDARYGRTGSYKENQGNVP